MDTGRCPDEVRKLPRDRLETDPDGPKPYRSMFPRRLHRERLRTTPPLRTAAGEEFGKSRTTPTPTATGTAAQRHASLQGRIEHGLHAATPFAGAVTFQAARPAKGTPWSSSRR